MIERQAARSKSMSLLRPAGRVALAAVLSACALASCRDSMRLSPESERVRSAPETAAAPEPPRPAPEPIPAATASSRPAAAPETSTKPDEVATDPAQGEAGSAELAWAVPLQTSTGEPLGDRLGGFRIYYGVAPDRLDNVLDVGRVTTYTFRRLPPGTYYFAVAAYTVTGVESAPSMVVSKRVGAP